MTYNVTGIVEALTTLGPKRLGLPNVTLVFSTDMNGMVTLKEAYIKMRYEYQEQVPVQQKEVTIKSDKDTDNTSSDGENDSEKTTVKTNEGDPSEKTSEDTKKTSDAAENTSEDGETTGDDKNTTAVEPPVQMATITKRKIRKVSLRVTSISDRLVIKPLTEEQRAQSIKL